MSTRSSALLEVAGVGELDKTPRNTVFISDPDDHRLEILPRSAKVLVLDAGAPERAVITTP